MFLGMSKFERTSYLCTLFDIECCQSVIRKSVYGVMCRLASSVNYIIQGVLVTSLRYTSRIRKHWCSFLSPWCDLLPWGFLIFPACKVFSFLDLAVYTCRLYLLTENALWSEDSQIRKSSIRFRGGVTPSWCW